MICVDSDCIIDFLKGKREAVEIINIYKDELVTTELNLFEIYFGIYQKKDFSIGEERSTDEFFNSLQVLPFDKECGKSASKILASQMRKGKMSNQNDVLIISILEKNEIPSIITKNVKHFSNIHGLKVVSY